MRRIVRSEWWAVVLWFGSLCGTALAFLPWWIHGPCTAVLIVLVSRAAGSANRAAARTLHKLFAEKQAVTPRVDALERWARRRGFVGEDD